jgi:hypothetical protein
VPASFSEVIKAGFMRAKIRNRIIELHVDKYGRLYADYSLFEGLDKKKKTTVLIKKLDSFYTFEFIQERRSVIS